MAGEVRVYLPARPGEASLQETIRPGVGVVPSRKTATDDLSKAIMALEEHDWFEVVPGRDTEILVVLRAAKTRVAQLKAHCRVRGSVTCYQTDDGRIIVANDPERSAI